MSGGWAGPTPAGPACHSPTGRSGPILPAMSLPSRPRHVVVGLLVAIGALAHGLAAPAVEVPVELLRVPGGGVQAQAALAADGTLQLVFLRGESAKADVFWARRAPGETAFGEPVRVNTTAGDAIAVGTIRGPQLSLSSGSAPVVLWNGAGEAGPGTHVGAPLFVSPRVADGRFAPERDVIHGTAHLDGGGSIAVGGPGQVFAVWQAAPAGLTGETNRGVFLAESKDGGVTFGPEARLDTEPLGACACCGLKALGRPDGALAVLYRSAAEDGSFRDMHLLLRSPEGTVRRVLLDRWSVRQCPMSSASLAWWGGGVLAAWETREEVQWALVDWGTGVPERLPAPAGRAARKHPSLAVAPGEGVLLAWVEGTGWARGGSVAWQHHDRSLHPTEAKGVQAGVPVWGSVAAFAAGGRYGVIY